MKLKKKIQTIGFVALSCVLLLGMINCKKVVFPDGIITIINECGLKVNIFLNGVLQFSLEYEATRSIEDLEDGVYDLEARRNGTGEFVGGDTLNVTFSRIYTWHVRSSASIKIINNYGETLSIYEDDISWGSLEDQANATVDNVPYGDRRLEAKTSDDTVVATTTISVLVDILYEWTVNK